MASKPDKTSKKQRKDEIIKYLIDKPGKEEKDVLKYCLEKGIGSKVTVNQAIRELLEEDILDSGKERKNSKSYKLTVKSNNLLLIVPKDLDEIFQQFKAFIDKVKSPINGIYTNPSNRDKIDHLSPRNVVSLLQYYIIEIINDVYLFYFVTILPYQLNNKDQINRLYLYYFDKIIEMYSLISAVSLTNNQPFDPHEIQQSKLREYYIKSKQQSLHSRLYEVAQICENLGIEVDLYNLLSLLWSKNKESAISLYGLTERYNPNLPSEEKGQDINGRAIYDVDKRLELFLFDIKNDKDKFMTKRDAFEIPKDGNM